MRLPTRLDGYAPIADYGVIGNERTAALVGLDGSIDFMCAPRFDSAAVFAAMLDASRGGSFTLAPSVPFEASHRYLPDTNILETTFRTAGGEVRVVDALAVTLTGPPQWEELIRKVEWVGGRVPMRWQLAPAFEWGGRRGAIEHRGEAVAIRDGDMALVLRAWEAGPLEVGEGWLAGELEVEEGSSPLLAVAVHSDQPWLVSSRPEVERRLDETCEYWRRWLQGCAYEGPWKEAVERSALSLAMLVHAPTGAMMAAATTSLPERIGGTRNFDYRYCWLRDTSFSLESILRLGRVDQVHATLTWLLRAIEPTNPTLQPFYGIDGAPHASQVELGLEGYRGSAPAVSGNDAGAQLQLGSYGDLLRAAAMFVAGGNTLGPAASERLATALDFLLRVWDNPDASIWELPEQRQYAQGKLAAWIGFERGAWLADRGELPVGRGERDRWRRAQDEIERFLDERCWSEERGSYMRSPGSEELDAGILFAMRSGFAERRKERFRRTMDAIEEELGAGGGLLHRYSGMQGQEGAFVVCSFWLAEGRVLVGERERGEEIMERMVGRRNELGLLSEQIDPSDGGFLGNLPQALSHLGLINSALALGGG